VRPPPVKVGLDVRSVLVHTRAALDTANDRLKNDDAFYSDVLAKFGK
jgi:hypothetical protein